MSKPVGRVSTLYQYTFRDEAGARLEVRVDDKPHEVTSLEAAKMSVAVMHAGGLLCATCLQEAAVRYVLTDAPTVAMCWECYDRKTTTGAHY